jgi:hypothetical protein
MRVLLSAVVALALAGPGAASSISFSSPASGATLQVGMYTAVTGTAQGQWPPAPEVVVVVYQVNGNMLVEVGYYLAQLDLNTGAWVTGYTPSAPGTFILSAQLYEGTFLASTNALEVTVVNPPVPKNKDSDRPTP